MKTTLIIDDGVMKRVRQLAAKEDRTISALVEAALRLLLARQPDLGKLPALPRFNGHSTHVDISSREALYKAMEDR